MKNNVKKRNKSALRTNPPIFSVIMPTYNGKEYIKRAIESVRAQTFKEWELIVVNDGGEDIGEVVNGFIDDRIKYLSIKHKGKAAALNYGIKRASAEYIAYIDDDDELLPNHLDVFFRTFKDNKCRIAFSSVYDTFLEKNGASYKVVKEDVFGKPADFFDLILWSRIGQISFVHEKKLLEEAGNYDQNLRRYIDWDILIRMTRISSPAFIPEVTGRRYWYFENNILLNRITGLSDREPETVPLDKRKIFTKASSLLTENEKEALLIKLMEDYNRRFRIEDEANELRDERNELVRKVKKLNSTIIRLDKHIKEIHNSKGWKTVLFIRNKAYKIKNRLNQEKVKVR